MPPRSQPPETDFQERIFPGQVDARGDPSARRRDLAEPSTKRALRDSRRMWQIIWMLPLAAAAGIVLAVVVGVRGETPRLAAFAFAALLSATAIALTLYVAGEDDYRRGGISRWEAYDAQAFTVTAIAIGLAAAVALVAAATRRRPSLAITGFLGSSAASVLFLAAFLANSLN